MFVGLVLPPPQSKVAPAVDDAAVRLTLVVVQVSMAGVAIDAFGALKF